MSIKRRGASEGEGQRRSARAKPKKGTGARGPARVAKSKAAAKARRARVAAATEKKAARVKSERARRARERDEETATPRRAAKAGRSGAAGSASGSPARGSGQRPARAPRAASATVLSRERVATVPKRASPAGPDVEAFLRELDHPCKEDLLLVRRIFLGVSPEITEIVKWNAPSFRTHEDFATLNLRYQPGAQVIFHLGVKTRPGAVTPTIEDPRGLVKWLAPDRCLVTLGAGRELAENREAFEAIVRAWIRQL